MKKLVIASAVAAVMASGAAAADTTLGGNIRLQMKNQDQLAMDSTKLVININHSEDLGNGMTAFAYLELEHDDADNEQAGWTNDKSFVGLKGDFGQLALGVQGDAAGFACGGTDIFVYRTGYACNVGATNGSLDNAATYVKAAGDLTFVAGMTFDGSLEDGEDTDGGAFGAQPAGGNHTLLAVNYGGEGFSVGGQLTSPDSDLDLDADSWVVLGGTVALGEATLGLTYAGNGGDDFDTAFAVAVSVPVAGGTLAAGIDQAGDDVMIQIGDAQDWITNNGDNSDAFETVTNVQFSKKLGKMAYWGVQFSSASVADDFGDDPEDIMAAWLGTKF